MIYIRATSELSLVRSEALLAAAEMVLTYRVHQLDNALLGVHVLDNVWVGGVWLAYSVCNIKGTVWHHAINIYIYTYKG